MERGNGAVGTSPRKKKGETARGRTAKREDPFLFELSDDLAHRLRSAVRGEKQGERERESAKEASGDRDNTLFTCQSCSLQYPEASALKEHKRSDLHRINLKRKLKALPPVPPDADLTEFLSESSSDEEEEEGEERKRNEAGEGEEEESLIATSAQFSVFQNEKDRVKLFNQVLGIKSGASVEEAEKALQGLLTSSFKCAVILMRSGRFAAGIFERNSLLCHKTFQRYTTRRKQGGSQSAHDAAGRAAKSAGASLRRYNEAALNEEVSQLLQSWAAELLACDLVFLSVSKRNRTTLLNEAKSPLHKNDPRIRSVPFATRRPTMEEVKATHQRLLRVTLEPVEKKEKREEDRAQSTMMEAENGMLALAVQGNTSLTLEQKEEEQAEEEQAEDKAEEETELFRAIRENDLKTVTTLLQTLGEEEINERTQDAEGLTALHVAAQLGHAKLVSLLLHSGASPQLLDFRERPPYFLSKNQPTRDAFRRFYGEFPTKYNYGLAGISSALTEEMEEKRRQKQREKRKRAKERKKEGKAAAEEEEEDADKEEEEDGETKQQEEERERRPYSTSTKGGKRANAAMRSQILSGGGRKMAPPLSIPIRGGEETGERERPRPSVPQPTPEEKRRLMLEAAMKRLGQS